MAKENKDLVFGLDIGTAKVMVVAAEVMPDGDLRVAGLGVAPAHGLKRGVVVNIDATVQSIQQALKEAEMMAACKIDRVYTGITGSHIRGQNSTGMVIVRDNREVTPVDVTRVVETAKAINIPGDQRLLLVEPQEFVIDGHEVKEPIGMSGSRLEVKVHIVTGAQSAAENILKCVRRCGLEVERLVLNPSASAAAPNGISTTLTITTSFAAQGNWLTKPSVPCLRAKICGAKPSAAIWTFSTATKPCSISSSLSRRTSSSPPICAKMGCASSKAIPPTTMFSSTQGLATPAV